MNLAGFQFPPNDRFDVTHKVGDSRVYEKTGRIDLEVFALEVKRSAVRANALVRVFTAYAKIGDAFGNAKGAFLSPPLSSLVGIGDGFEDANWRGRDKDLRQDRVVVRSDLSCCHLVQFP